MNRKDFTEMLEMIAPKELALSYDNVGLLIGTDREIRKVLVALDCTIAVAREAVDIGADLVLTHHPLFFHGVNRILPDDPETAAAYLLIRNRIGLYAAHTNLDAADGGVNDALAETLGVSNCRPLCEDGIGRVGVLQKPMPLRDFVQLCNASLHTTVRFFGDPDRMVQTVGLIGGAGGGNVDDAARCGCDVYVTGEMKHHEVLRAEFYHLPCVVAGHYETEVVVLKKWISRLQNAENDVQYYETSLGKAPLMTHEEDEQ